MTTASAIDFCLKSALVLCVAWWKAAELTLTLCVRKPLFGSAERYSALRNTAFYEEKISLSVSVLVFLNIALDLIFLMRYALTPFN